jgi:hypothetical protein
MWYLYLYGAKAQRHYGAKVKAKTARPHDSMSKATQLREAEARLHDFKITSSFLMRFDN